MRVIDYTTEDFSQSGRVYDVVFDAVGRSGFSRSLKAFKKGGCYVRVGASGGTLSILGSMLREVWTSRVGAVNIVGGVAVGTREPASSQGVDRGSELRTVIDRCYSMNDIAEAHRLAETGHKKGHVVVLLQEAPR